MNITMLTIGSTGDVRPYVLLGRELQRRGHAVTLAAFAPFQDLVEKAGLHFYALSGDVVDLMQHFMKPGANGVRYLWEVEKAIRTVAPVLLADLTNACDGADAMICTFFGTLFYSIAEKYRIPCVQTHYFPMDPNPLMPISSAPFQNLGPLWNRFSYRLGYLLISLLEKRYLTAWRKSHGMDLRRLHTRPDYTAYGHRVPAIYAASPLLMPRPDSWDERIYQSGFWWDEQPMSWNPPQALLDFIAAGEKPVYIGFGSMVSGDMEQTMSTVCEAVEKAGLRAVIGTGWGGKQHAAGSARLYFGEYIPHDWLFPRVCAAVHHGGAGTTASSLRSGLPTLVIPFGGDQPFWGTRVAAIGCGPKPLPRDHMTVDALASRLTELVENPAYRQNAAEIGAKLRAEHGVQTAADIVEKEFARWLAEDAESTAQRLHA